MTTGPFTIELGPFTLSSPAGMSLPDALEQLTAVDALEQLTAPDALEQLTAVEAVIDEYWARVMTSGGCQAGADRLAHQIGTLTRKYVDLAGTTSPAVTAVVRLAIERVLASTTIPQEAP